MYVLGIRVVFSVNILLREYFRIPVYQGKGTPAAHVARSLYDPWYFVIVGLGWGPWISDEHFFFLVRDYLPHSFWGFTQNSLSQEWVLWWLYLKLCLLWYCVSLLPFFNQPPRCFHCLTCSVFACLSCFLFQPHMTVGSARAGILFTIEPQCLEQCLAQNRCSVYTYWVFRPFSTLSIF